MLLLKKLYQNNTLKKLYQNLFIILFYKCFHIYIIIFYNQSSTLFFIINQGADDKWSIHGLWQKILEKYPQFCNPNATFNLNKLDSIINRLHEDLFK